MAYEQIKPNRPNFGTVVLLAAAAMIVILIVAVVVVRARSHAKDKPPYTKAPSAMNRIKGSSLQA